MRPKGPKRLGRGLSNLLNRTEEAPPAAADAGERAEPLAAPAMPEERERVPAGARVLTLALSRIRRNPYQPRTVFDEEGIRELAASIEEHGVIQPIVVRATDAGFELVAGERRLRAVESLGLEEIPALLRGATTDEEMQILALVENVQREDLNAMEKARAMRAMMRNFEFTQEDVAKRVGKARATVANLLRLLDLPNEIQEFVEGGALSGAHARALLQARSAERRIQLAQRAIKEGLSVRALERLAREADGRPAARRQGSTAEDPYLADLSERIRKALAAAVQLRPTGKGGGVIEIRYRDPDDLDRLLERFGA